MITFTVNILGLCSVLLIKVKKRTFKGSDLQLLIKIAFTSFAVSLALPNIARHFNQVSVKSIISYEKSQFST
jgi:Na+-transporting NADH:ubiquinone oxidoreductase subunit NqrD